MVVCLKKVRALLYSERCVHTIKDIHFLIEKTDRISKKCIYPTI